VVDSDLPWSEDEYAEIRIDRCLLRFCGPTGRCPYVYQNWQKAEGNPDDEPLQTLRTFRMMKQGFAAFGNYYQVELVEDPSIYSKVFPTELGYPAHSSLRKVEYRPADKMPYLEVTTDDVIRLRKVARMPWQNNIQPPK
jgi:hypothetical protein